MTGETTGSPRRQSLGAFDRALKYLELRPHFRREVELKLRRAGYEDEELAEAVGRLARLGYLDDETLAKSFAATLATRKGHGSSRIRQELLRRGAPAEAVAAALAAAEPGEELERAREAGRKWLGSTSRRGGGPAAALARHLARKGFDGRVIFSVLKELAPTDGDSTGETFAEE